METVFWNDDDDNHYDDMVTLVNKWNNGYVSFIDLIQSLKSVLASYQLEVR